MDHNKLWKILKEMGIPDHFTCVRRKFCVGQEATVRTLHGTMDWFQIGKEVRQGVYCHPAYLTYTQSTSCEMPSWVQVGIKIAGRNINNLRYEEDTILMAESQEELKSLLMRVKGK